MIFGLRFDCRNPGFAGVSATDRYRAVLDMCEWADRRGALFVSLSEHHGSDDDYLPSPLVMAAAIAARTKRVRIGINALVASFHDPLRLAEDAAVVDLLSGGRLDLTLAGGYVKDEFDMFGVALSERPARVREAVAALRAAWTGEPFEFRGRTVRVRPRPAQPGGPKILLGGTSEGAARRAARIADGFIPSEPGCCQFYRDECLKLGKADPGPGMTGQGDLVILAEAPDAAWPELGPYFLHETNAYGAWQAAAKVAATYSPQESIDELRASGRYRILTPGDYAAELEEGGFAFAVLHPMVGGIPPDLAWRHLRLFEAAFLPSGGARAGGDEWVPRLSETR
jgi:alkanesulfonate monooxygenase SsuD/methylene tetrahydromethanopterin reductase-like flavin-dependent oxidoreductase (luciferase family)